MKISGKRTPPENSPSDISSVKTTFYKFPVQSLPIPLASWASQLMGCLFLTLYCTVFCRFLYYQVWAAWRWHDTNYSSFDWLIEYKIFNKMQWQICIIRIRAPKERTQSYICSFVPKTTFLKPDNDHCWIKQNNMSQCAEPNDVGMGPMVTWLKKFRRVR